MTNPRKTPQADSAFTHTCSVCDEANLAEAYLGGASEEAYADVMRGIEGIRAEHPNHPEREDV